MYYREKVETAKQKLARDIEIIQKGIELIPEILKAFETLDGKVYNKKFQDTLKIIDPYLRCQISTYDNGLEISWCLYTYTGSYSKDLYLFYNAGENEFTTTETGKLRFNFSVFKEKSEEEIKRLRETQSNYQCYIDNCEALADEYEHLSKEIEEFNPKMF